MTDPRDPNVIYLRAHASGAVQAAPVDDGSPKDILMTATAKWADSFESVIITGWDKAGNLTLLHCGGLSRAEQVLLLMDTIDEVRNRAQSDRSI